MPKSCVEENVELLIGVILAKILDGKPVELVTFLPKYADFVDIFDKREVDILANYSQYDLVIEIERDKI